ncbi:hypothetical protein V5O48_017135, partial [Marasmius crinis-equi]
GEASPEVDRQIFRSGTVLPPSELIDHDRLLESDEQLMRRQDETIAFFEAVVEQFKVDRELVQVRIDARKALRSPIRRLPVELLMRIFVFTCSSMERDDEEPPFFSIALPGREGHHPPEAIVPQVLSRVCFTWKSIAEGLSSLWTSLTFSIPRTRGQHKTLRRILALSGSQQLRLSIQGGDWYPDSPPAASLALLRSALNRCSELHVNYSFLSGTELGAFECRNLKRLFLHVRGSYGLNEETAFSIPQLTTVIQAPALETFWSDSFTEIAQDDIYPAPTISSFECLEGSLTHDHLTTLVRACPRIRSLSVKLKTSTFRHSSPDHLLLPHLERLEFKCDHSDRMFFLSRLTTPRLRELVLPAGQNDVTQERFIDFLNRSGCRLTLLDCYIPLAFDGTDDRTTLSRIVEKVPDLQTFRVRVTGTDSWEGENDLLVITDVLGGERPHLPRLAFFHVRAHGGHWREPAVHEVELLVGRFFDFAESRSRLTHPASISPLQAVSLLVESKNAWGDSPTLPLHRELEARRTALVFAGMECNVYIPTL